MDEIWLDVVGYEDSYIVSNKGNIKSKDRVLNNRWGPYLKKGTLLKQFNTGKDRNYLSVDLSGKTKRVHRIVAEAFIPNLHSLPQVNHIDEDTKNNSVENLEWITNLDNANHGTRNKRLGTPVIGKNILNGEIIFLETMSEGVKFGFRPDGISDCCRDKNKTHSGYTWKYFV